MNFVRFIIAAIGASLLIGILSNAQILFGGNFPTLGAMPVKGEPVSSFPVLVVINENGKDRAQVMFYSDFKTFSQSSKQQWTLQIPKEEEVELCEQVAKKQYDKAGVKEWDSEHPFEARAQVEYTPAGKQKVSVTWSPDDDRDNESTYEVIDSHTFTPLAHTNERAQGMLVLGPIWLISFAILFGLTYAVMPVKKPNT